MTEKELADQWKEQDLKRERRATKEKCQMCGGIGWQFPKASDENMDHLCLSCNGRGFKWKAPHD